MSGYRVVLADGHPVFRQSLKRILLDTTHYDVVGEAGDGLDLLDLLNSSRLAPHMVILDLSLPNLQGPDAVRKIKMIQPEAKVLIIGAHKDREYLNHAISSGAEGYLIKTDVDRELFPAMETIRHGNVYFSLLK